MGLIIYGSPRSRTMRVLWAAAELGLSYEHVPLEWDDPALKSPEFLRINPAGAIPAIVDDDFALAESLAINLHLARKHGAGSLWPEAFDAQSEILRWTVWAQGHLEPWVQQDALLEDLRAAVKSHAWVPTHRALGLLETRLKDRDWLVGEAFTVADLNVAGVLSPSRAARLDLDAYPTLRDWLARCYGRPAAIETRARYAA